MLSSTKFQDCVVDEAQQMHQRPRNPPPLSTNLPTAQLLTLHFSQKAQVARSLQESKGLVA